MARKLRPMQIELLKMLATCGEAPIDAGAEWTCARGLRFRKVPLVELRWGHPEPEWTAQLTEAGARAFEQHSNFNLQENEDGSWTIVSVREATKDRTHSEAMICGVRISEYARYLALLSDNAQRHRSDAYFALQDAKRALDERLPHTFRRDTRKALALSSLKYAIASREAATFCTTETSSL